MLSHGQDGFLIPAPVHPKNSARAIRRLCENPDERTALGSAALNKVTRELARDCRKKA